MIDYLMKLYKMIFKKEDFEKKTGKGDIQINQRLLVMIKLLIKENQFLPNAFKYNG